ncbi:hypothetical protein LINGRAHAP2_LOCUS36311, partial [Linum grandiflorum]
NQLNKPEEEQKKSKSKKQKQKPEKLKNEKNSSSMAESVDVNAKWDACIDLTVRRTVYSTLASSFGGLLFFRSPVSRWASVAFGAGIGVGAAYTECSRMFEGSPATSSAPKVTTSPPPPKVVESPPTPQEDKTET